MRRQPGGEAAVGVLGRVAEGHVLALHPATHERSGHPHVIQDDFALRLSDEELRDLRTDIAELFDRWGALSRDRAAAEDGQERRPYYGIVLGALVDDIERAASGRDLS